MAVIKFGSVVTGGRGSLGGSTIQPDRSGHIWRNKPFPTKSRTQAQSVIRSINKTMQAGWRSLSDQDRKVWNDYAKEKPVFNRTGEKHPLSGHSLWLKYQFDALQKGAPFMSDPSEYPGPYYGPELVPDPFFQDPASWGVTASWVVSLGNAQRPAGIVGNFFYTGLKPDLIIGAAYQIKVFFLINPVHCEFYLDPLEKRRLYGIGYQSIVDTMNSVFFYCGARSNNLVSLSSYSVKRIYQ